jgi:hypothetical protein
MTAYVVLTQEKGQSEGGKVHVKAHGHQHEPIYHTDFPHSVTEYDPIRGLFVFIPCTISDICTNCLHTTLRSPIRSVHVRAEIYHRNYSTSSVMQH